MEASPELGVVLAVLLAMALAVVVLDRRHSAGGGPRVRKRSLPAIRSSVEGETASGTRLTIAGRTYEVVEPEARGDLGGQCPWCLEPLGPEESDELVRCPHPQCRRVGHRRHVEEFGGCGGVCGLLG